MDHSGKKVGGLAAQEVLIQPSRERGHAGSIGEREGRIFVPTVGEAWERKFGIGGCPPKGHGFFRRLCTARRSLETYPHRQRCGEAGRQREMWLVTRTIDIFIAPQMDI
jgi:hypothetical protein